MLVKVAIYGTTGKVVSFDPKATVGATIGTDLKLPDGSIATLASLAALIAPLVNTTPVGSTGAIAHSTLAGLTAGDDHPQYTRRDILTTRGDMYVEGASALVRLAVGTNHQVLMSNGTDPVWTTLFANPTADVGLTAVNGSAATAMRSDAAPALDQSIVPSWTGQHTFSLTPLVGSTKVVLESRQVLAGSGLTGGGALTGDVTLTLDHTVFAIVAFSGAYSDLSGTPTIPADIHTATFLTTAAEAGLPNSRREVAGTNVSFDDSVAGVRTINVTGGGSGSVTSVSITAPAAGITQSGSPITTSGSITLALANDLAALEALSGTGIAVRSATDTWVQRQIAGTASQIAVANGDGVSGNPTISIDSGYVGQSSITTLGTITTGTWNGTAIALANIATIAASTILGNNTAGTHVPIALTTAQVKTLLAIAASDVSGLATVATSGSASDLSTGTLPAGRMPALTGDVTTSAGAVATTIAAAAVTLAKMANLAANSIIGNNTGSPATPIALTVAQVKTLLAYATTDLSDVSSGTYAGTLTGITGGSQSPASFNVRWARVGNIVTITIPAVQGTSNSTAMTVTGSLPAAIQPAIAQVCQFGILLNNGSANLSAPFARVDPSSSTITLGFGGTSAGFTNTGTKGISSNSTFTYQLT